MPAKALIKVDLQIAKLRDKIASNDGVSQTADADLAQLLDTREKLVQEFVDGETARRNEPNRS